MFRSLLILCWLSCAFSATLTAQSWPCGTDVLRANRLMAHESERIREAAFNESVYRIIRSGNHATGSVTIPVVFHVMHDNGPENISDSVLTEAISQLNLRYQNAAPYFDSTGHAIQVQFCLASVDPDGNPTSGVTRTVTPLTEFTFPTDDKALKKLDRWSPDLYYNVWVVRVIFGFIDGYSTFPFDAGREYDGVVIEYSYVTNSYLLGHETGHYCGLYHTFQNGCNNYNCLLDGDQVCDTPPDNSSTGFPCMTNSCTTELQDTSGFNPFPADVNELPNYMDYTTCPLSFSQGQAERVETSVSSLRQNLLLSNGCGNNPGQPAPAAAFSMTVSPCNDGTVWFDDSNSQNGLTSEWDFDNDGQFDTLAHQFTWTFPASGTYLVTLRVTGIGGRDTVSQQVTVRKGATVNYPIIAYPQAVTDTLEVCTGDLLTFDGDPAGVSYLWSTGDTTASISFVADTSVDVMLTMIDTAGFTWSSSCRPVHVRVHPFNTPAISYIDTVGYLCQGNAVTLYIANVIPGTYTWWVYHISTGWVNTGSHDTTYQFIPDPATGNHFYVTFVNGAGCSAQSNFLLLQPQYLPFFTGSPLSVNGNTLSHLVPIGAQMQWTNYGIPIPGATFNSYNVTGTGCYGMTCYFPAFPACAAYTDTVCFIYTGIGDPAAESIRVFPNPAHHVITLSWESSFFPERIALSDCTGKVWMQERAEALRHRSYQFDVSALPSGVYLLSVQTASGTLNRKIFKF